MPRTTDDQENDALPDLPDVRRELRNSQKNETALKQRVLRLERLLADKTNAAQHPEGDESDESPQPPAHSSRRRGQQIPEGSDDDSHAAPPLPGSRSSPASGYAFDDLDEGTIAGWGEAFTIKCCPWLVADSVFSVVLDAHWNKKKRFEKKKGKYIPYNLIQGQLREMLDIVPPEYHSARSTPRFKKWFKWGMQRTRQHWSQRLRTSCPDKIFGHERSVNMETSNRRFEVFAADIGHKGGNGTAKSRYSPTNCPIIHSSLCATFDARDAFTNKLPKTVLIGLLRGGLAARSFMRDNADYSTRGNEIQVSYDISHCTPGMIALAHVATRWALSADIQFRSIGAQTGINWMQDFYVYLALFLNGLDRDPPSQRIKQLFRDWDLDVFDSTHSPFGGDGPEEPELRDQDIDDAMAQMDEDEDEGAGNGGESGRENDGDIDIEM